MFINSLNILILIISFDISQSNNNNKVKNVLSRSRRQSNIENYMNSCTDECIVSNSNTISQNIYKFKELRNLCKETCKKQVELIRTNSKQNKEEEEENENKYHHELQPISSRNMDCEMKCLALKAFHRSIGEKKNFCRKQCSYA